HLSHGVGESGWQWVIAANHQAFSAVGVDQVVQHVLAKGNGVKGKLLDIGRGWAWHGSSAFGVVLVPHIEAPEQAWESPSCMIQHHTQSGMPFQNPAVDK